MSSLNDNFIAVFKEYEGTDINEIMENRYIMQDGADENMNKASAYYIKFLLKNYKKPDTADELIQFSKTNSLKNWW